MGNDNILVIGIAGGSASGKTTLMKNLIADCEDEVHGAEPRQLLQAP